MTDVQIKTYFEKRYPDETIDFSDVIMARVQNKNNRSLVSKPKMFLVAALIALMTLGCGLLVVNEYHDSDGGVAWVERFEQGNMEEMSTAIDYFNDLDLVEGETVSIIFEDTLNMYFNQEPWRFETYEEAEAYGDMMQLNVPEALADMTFHDGIYHNTGYMGHGKVEHIPDGYIKDQDLYVKKGDADPNMMVLQLWYGENKDYSIAIHQIDAQMPVELGEGEVMVQVTHYNAPSGKTEIIDVVGTQGRVMTIDGTLQYSIVYDGYSITVTDTYGTMLVDGFEELVINMTE